MDIDDIHLGSSVVIAASGPSLRDVDPWLPGLPVVAISTAVNEPRLRKPTMWVVGDTLNGNHGKFARAIWNDPEVIKVTPIWVKAPGVTRNNRGGLPGSNVVRVPYSRTWREDARLMKEGRTYMDGQLPLLRHTHKSITIAFGFLALIGVTEMIICGCDCKCGKGPRQKYGYDTQRHTRNLNHLASSLRQTRSSIKKFHEAALLRGITMRSWSPGGAIEDFMERYNDPRCPRPSPPSRSEPAAL